MFPDSTDTSSVSTAETKSSQISLKFSPGEYPPPIEVKFGDGGYGNQGERDGHWERECKINGVIVPQNRFNRQLLAEKLPFKNTNRYPKDIRNKLPGFGAEANNNVEFNFLDQLNAANLKLPSAYFRRHDPEQTDTLDAALSAEGLQAFMQYYSKAMKMDARVFMCDKDFVEQVDNIKKAAEKAPVACVIYLEPSKRHATGFYFVVVNKQLTCFVFDTMGLTLPAYPCGQRYGESEAKVARVLKALQKNNIYIALTPINTVLSMQADSYSCLMATLLFFEGMQRGDYQMVEKPGITESYGDSAFDFNNKKQSYVFSIFGAYDEIANEFLAVNDLPVKLFAIKYLPLLVGVQQTLAFLFMLDPLENGENILLEAVRYRTDWYKFTSECWHNTFWPTAYIKLLKGFESYYLNSSNTVEQLPDFFALMKSCSVRTSKSLAEERVDAIKAIFPTGYLVSPSLYNKFSSLFAEEEKPKPSVWWQVRAEQQPLLSSNQNESANCCVLQ